MIRAAAPSDAAASAGLRRHWCLERHGTAPDTEEGFEARFTEWYAGQLASGSRAWLAYEGAEPVGMLVMFVHERMPEPGRDAGCWGYVGNVFVLPQLRDAGTGRRLLEAALDHADAHGFARVVLNPSPRSVPFYERAGFVGDHPLLVRE